jgi:hypothetical protein
MLEEDRIKKHLKETEDRARMEKEKEMERVRAEEEKARKAAEYHQQLELQVVGWT